jgi:MoxR-like ATPase
MSIMSDQLPLSFIGVGDADDLVAQGRPRPATWQRYEASEGEDKLAPLFHPERYIAHPDVVAAVNTALLLGKPLLLAGNPGTGKTQLADRIAWERSLGAVLRFEAQSVSEAQDLFYRFDLVGQMTRAQLRDLPEYRGQPVDPLDFVQFGPLGKAILMATPLPKGEERARQRRALLRRALGKVETEAKLDDAQSSPARAPQQSVVLIDEIDKASRDFPNDLLNAIERLTFSMRELKFDDIRVPEASEYRPIVVITSNGEREIPAPFLRRCVFCHIPDPTVDELRKIVWNRVLREAKTGGGAADAPTKLPVLYEQLLGMFDQFRKDEQSFAYRPGPAELVDWSRAIHLHSDAQPDAELSVNKPLAVATSSAVAKNQRDRQRLLDLFKKVVDPTPLPKSAPLRAISSSAT